LISWEELPEDERQKDFNSMAKLPQTLAKHGYEIIEL
jgi:hypothetical protein